MVLVPSLAGLTQRVVQTKGAGQFSEHEDLPSAGMAKSSAL